MYQSCSKNQYEYIKKSQNPFHSTYQDQYEKIHVFLSPIICDFHSRLVLFFRINTRLKNSLVLVDSQRYTSAWIYTNNGSTHSKSMKLNMNPLDLKKLCFWPYWIKTTSISVLFIIIEYSCQSNIIHCYSSFLYHHHFCLVLDYYPFSLHTIINSFHLLQPSNSTSEPCYYDVPVPTQDSSLYAMKEYSHDLNHSLPFLRSISVPPLFLYS